jgi:vacuolar-type H+-ATPase subunit I/STV1
MPIARMSKVAILAPCEYGEELIQRLYELGAVHVVNLPSRLEEEIKELAEPCRPEVRELRLSLSKSDFLIELLERFEEKKGGLLGSFLQERVHLTYEEFLRVEREIDLEALYRELEEIDIQLRHTESRILETRRSLEALGHWKDLLFPLGELGRLRWCRAALVTLGAPGYAAWAEEWRPPVPIRGGRNSAERGSASSWPCSCTGIAWTLTGSWRRNTHWKRSVSRAWRELQRRR